MGQESHKKEYEVAHRDIKNKIDGEKKRQPYKQRMFLDKEVLGKQG